MTSTNPTKIILSGGGTLGPVFPLLALAEKITSAYPAAEFLWLGTKNGPERDIVKAHGIRFRDLSAGKFRRYFSWRNFRDLFLIKWGFWQALFLLAREKPAIVVSAGGFNSVPTVWAAWFLRIPCFIHQQDLQPGLANRLMAPFAREITVAFKTTLRHFQTRKTTWIGNPVRAEIFQGDSVRALQTFHLENDLPTVLIIGGGTGATGLNDLVLKSLPALTKFCQIVHSTGPGKSTSVKNPRYHPFDFIKQGLPDIMAAADLVVTRAGLSTLSELAVLGKPMVIIPMPDSHQEINARYFERHQSAIVAAQKKLTPAKLTNLIATLLRDQPHRALLGQHARATFPADAAKRWLAILRPWLNRV